MKRTDDQINDDIAVLLRAMLDKLEANKSKPYWDKESLLTLAKLMQGEVDELVDAILHGSQQDIIMEAADVANFAMMIASNAKRGMK
jgi:NTP pyrophosphatase (non-canonical NTP hydrolase)